MKPFKQLKEELAKESDTIVVDGVTRSRLNSNGKPIYPTEEGIINFWKWFGDSQVVDKSGNPLVMYHGTVTWERKDGRQLGDIHSFNRKASVDIVRRPPSADTVGIWFSNKVQGGADQYGDTFYPVYLKVMDAKRTTFDGMLGQAYEEDKGFRPTDIHDKRYMPDSMEPYRAWLKSEGYDGLNMIHDPSNRNSNEFQNQVVYVVLEPNQIKSAIGNKGSFDGSSDKIVEAELFHKTLKESSDIDWIAGIPVMTNDQCVNLHRSFPKLRFTAITESGLVEHNKYPSWDNAWEMDKQESQPTPYTDLINESIDSKIISELFDPVESDYGNNPPEFNNKQMGGKSVNGKFALATYTKFNDVVIGITFRQNSDREDEWSVDFRTITDPTTTPTFDRQQSMVNSIRSMTKLYSSLAYIIKDVAADHKEFRYITFTPATSTSQEDQLTSLYNKFQLSASFQKMISNLGWKHVKNNRYIRASDKIVEGVNQVESPEFKKWFGDSKVVGKNGNPLVVYHGTHNDFTEFKVNDALGGIFFSPDKEEANAFVSGKGGNVIPVFLRAERVWPKIVRSYDEVNTIKKAKENGYDSIRVKDSINGVVNWVVFSPNQIKSAIGNIGSFNADSPNITEAEQLDMFQSDFANKRSTVKKTKVVSSKGATEVQTLKNVNSKGQRIALTKQSLDNFWNWFSDSKAVDHQDRPMVFYHGTRTDVSKFKSGVASKNTGLFGYEYDAVRHAIFFTAETRFANSFAQISGSGSNVIPVYLYLNNPAILSRGVSEQLENELEKVGYNVRMIGSVQYTWELFDEEFGGKHFVDSLKKAGYDSVIFNEEDDDGHTIPTFAVFDSNQVKSAIGNVGSFNADSDNITEEVKIKPLYVHRPLLNPQPLIQWAKEQGFTKTLTPDDFHVTIVYSKKPVEWNKFTPDTKQFKNTNDDRAMDKFGDAVVLKFVSPTLNKRHQQFKEGGASWDYPNYQPHITITYDGGDVDVKALQSYEGVLAFGAEEFEDLDEDWSESIDEVVAQ